MVEIVKFLPNVSNYFPSNICDSRNKLNVQRTCFLRLPPHNYNIQNDRVSSINTKLWIDHCSHNSSHLLDASSVPYSLHRKVMYEELSRHQTTTVNFTRRSRNNSQQRQQQQQRNATNNVFKGIGGTSNTSQTSFSSLDSQRSHVLNTLSKYITIKPEPLRPPNHFTNNSTSKLSSWQKYWTLKYAERRWKEMYESETGFYHPKCEKQTESQTHFVVHRDSPLSHNETSLTSLPNPSYNDPLESTILDKPISSTIQDNIIDIVKQVSLIETTDSSSIPLSSDVNSSTVVSTSSKNKADVKYLVEDSVLLSSSSSFSMNLKSDNQTIQITGKQKEIVPLTTGTIKHSSLASFDKIKVKRPTLRERRKRSKSSEKILAKIPSASKSNRQVLKNQHLPNKSKQVPLSTTTITLRSKYSDRKWDEPYVGHRFDPPPPPSSPSLCTESQNNDISLK